ncbi:DUF4258 domain-containing protein [Aeromonas salmonicida]|uniref:DUF4258 domain-containing protein n=1 Tax=Aeromonas salmonicida TaxID=645 RepID=UPI001F4083C7|nr:DUF4258 domain-containing protein [Aeromonas salmonicida]MCE9935096.1 DUF4258 domain-containing protein [Aeromonas salmonicida]
MSQLMCRNQDIAYSRHALRRMQQRGIAAAAVDTLLIFGCSTYHRGREVVYFDRTAFRQLQAGGELTPQACERLRRHYLVLEDGDIVTVGHRTTHFKRDRH